MGKLQSCAQPRFPRGWRIAGIALAGILFVSNALAAGGGTAPPGMIQATDEEATQVSAPPVAAATTASLQVTVDATRVLPGSRAPEYPQTDYQQAPGYQQSLGYQQPTGDQLIDYTRNLRAYNYLVENYQDLAEGPKQYADYAPSGFLPNTYQEAPGAPLYRLLRPAPALTAEQLDELVVRGPVPGSFLVPGTGTAFRLSGFVRMGANFDFDPLTTPDLFLPRAIPIPEQAGQNANFSARPTRLTLDTWTPLPDQDLTVHSLVQFDFLSGNPPGVGASNVPRLRLAFFDVGYLRIGQDTTVFMDPGVFPRTADFQGPNGIVNSRQGLARLTIPLAEQLRWAAAIEQPFSDITTLNTGTNEQDIPDLTSHLRYQTDLYHMQVAGIARSIGYRPTGEQVTRRGGWGANASAGFHPWAILCDTNPVRDPNPSGWTRSRVLVQYVTGSGIGRYLQDSNGQGLDAAVTAAGGFETLDATGWTTTYEHWFNQYWLINLTYSDLDIDGTDALPGNTLAASKYVATSLWWIPMRNMSIGVEYLWGERENLDGQNGRAERIQTAFAYNF
ncbi:MAG: hypothetical protein SFX18_13945 [Pirellulales bacterium]|nr:hypothetical protein [Pirellulales bacterium]